MFLALEVQERSNAPVPGQNLATKVSKSRAIPPYVPYVIRANKVRDDVARLAIIKVFRHFTVKKITTTLPPPPACREAFLLTCSVVCL